MRWPTCCIQENKDRNIGGPRPKNDGGVADVLHPGEQGSKLCAAGCERLDRTRRRAASRRTRIETRAGVGVRRAGPERRRAASRRTRIETHRRRPGPRHSRADVLHPGEQGSKQECKLKLRDKKGADVLHPGEQGSKPVQWIERGREGESRRAASRRTRIETSERWSRPGLAGPT